MKRTITSMYWDNVPAWIPKQQRAVLESLGLSINQEEATGTPHGNWLNDVTDRLEDQDVVLFMDVDCVPLNKQVVERAFSSAEAGKVFGVAQTANHLSDSNLVYAAPSFLCFSKLTWNRLGRVSLGTSEENDAAMGLTKAARQHGDEVEILLPSYVCCPKWRLSDWGATGYGTFYDGSVFHLFQSRDNEAYDVAFRYVTECVLAHQSIDFVALHQMMNSNTQALKELWYRVLKRLS